ncbi:Cyclin-like F-box [Penicillium digitatum]|uniref:F-box domain-containing protein n=3 Tax=Penicillium digitatum TaxID=36651 RepID=K9GKD4_PEND2|nr:hypothetical protein PDIP_63080 [Penicillium digitatum Pd1]EKV09814.1 hypothetical protein PDIP_63080 [Penicillium digitatum Pd1]EKV15183.1 hypothetical protein PDIG_28640 [Penicillium digitatum PHI26]QQK44491.1 Cyclin-like F-box [Penicillium digitatum]
MESTPLTQLPQDCWLLMLECLPQRDLNNLSLVSRDTRVSAEPFLYRSIHWDWKQPPIHKILLLLRTLSERPDLADCIWHVSLVWWDVESQRTEVSIPKGILDWAKSMLQFRPTLRWARKVVRDAKFPTRFETKWICRLFDGDAYAYATLLVSQLHSLRSLRLDFSFVLEGGFPGEMLHHALFGNVPPGTLSQFSKLEMADYGSNFPLKQFRDGVNLGKTYQFIPWFHLPSLKTLEIWLYKIEGICNFPGEMPKRLLNLPNLRSLVVAKTLVLPGDITTLLCQLPYLESLHVGMAYKCRTTAEFLKEPECLLRSLETSGQAIKHLSISMELLPCCAESFRLRAMDEVGQPFHGILKKFPNLRTASLPLNFLIGWDTTAYKLRDVLPSTLEALHIRADLWQTSTQVEFEMEALEALESLMRHKQRGSHPSLRTFSYQGQNEYNDNELAALGFQDDFKFSYLIKREAMGLFCHRQGYKLFSQYGDCTPGFMTRGVTLVDNVVYRLPWPFVRVDDLPASVPRHSRTTSILSSDQ